MCVTGKYQRIMISELLLVARERVSVSPDQIDARSLQYSSLRVHPDGRPKGSLSKTKASIFCFHF